MRTIEQRAWLALLLAERARRAARVEWQAAEGERRRQWLLEELAAMAERLAATAHLYPLSVDDMSIAEMLACRWFLPDELQPTGLGTEEQIWADYEARRRPKSPGTA